MNVKLRKSVLGVSIALALAGCGGDDDGDNNSTNNVDNTGGITTNPLIEGYLVYATDKGGNINVYADDGKTNIKKLRASTQKNEAGQPFGLGEIHFNDKGKGLVVVSSNMLDNGVNVGGGFIIIDAVTGNPERVVPLKAANGIPTRPVHVYPDPNGTHIWLNNDGPRDEAAPDSVFRVNWDPTDTEDTDGPGPDDKYLDVKEIVLGNGHKKSALAHGDKAPLLFASHNGGDRTVSIVDNDPASPTFLQVIKVVDLGAENVPHGMDFSPVSGHFYVGITTGGMAIIDASRPDPNTPPTFELTLVPAGVNPGEIPASGYTHVSPEGDYVYTTGYKDSMGYLSILHAEDNDVVQVIPLGDLKSSSFDMAEMDMPDGDKHLKVFVPGAKDSALNNQIAVLELDHDTGIQKVGTTIANIPVFAGPSHRNGQITEGGEHAYYPNGGDCGVAPAVPGPGCNVITVIDAHTNQVIKEITTDGPEPGGIGIVKAMISLDGVATSTGNSSGGAPAASDGHNHKH